LVGVQTKTRAHVTGIMISVVSFVPMPTLESKAANMVMGYPGALIMSVPVGIAIVTMRTADAVAHALNIVPTTLIVPMETGKRIVTAQSAEQRREGEIAASRVLILKNPPTLLLQHPGLECPLFPVAKEIKCHGVGPWIPLSVTSKKHARTSVALPAGSFGRNALAANTATVTFGVQGYLAIVVASWQRTVVRRAH